MTTVAPPTRAEKTSPWKVDWIISSRTDLLFFIGAAIGGYIFFILHIFHRSWHIDMVMVYFLWLAFIDAPHFFDTFSRTYLDRQEMKKRRLLLLGSLLFLLAGPFVLFICYLMHRAGATNHYAPYAALGAFVGVWAYWHVVRQHYGILSLYKRKNQDFARLDRWIDNTLLYAGTMAPFVALTFRHPVARHEVSNLTRAGFVAAGWTQAESIRWFERTSDLVFYASVALVMAAATVFLIRQLWRFSRRESINVPKLLFFLAVIPLHNFVLYHSAVLTAQLFMVAAFVTIFHDFQYHAIVWHYQQNRCHKGRGAGAESSTTTGGTRPGNEYGLATHVSRNPFVFFGCAIIMGVVGAYVGCKLDIVAGCSPMIPASQMYLFGDIRAFELFTSVMLGFLMHHYFVDQFIWRPSKDERLRKDLRISH